MEQSPAAAAPDILPHLVEVEALAEEILADRQQIVDLDRRRHQTREAQRALQKEEKKKKAWVCFGNMFVKLPVHQTQKMLTQDYDELDKEIGKLRAELKPKVGKLRDAEKQEELKGFDLQPLTKEELKAVRDLL